jgi:hypothetical protein
MEEMGVDRTDYLMFGVKVNPRAVDYDRHQAMIEGQPGAPFDLIDEGMSGKYAVAGKIIAKLDNYDGIEFIEITDDLLPKDPEGLSAVIAQELDLPEPPKQNLCLFSHFS